MCSGPAWLAPACKPVETINWIYSKQHRCPASSVHYNLLVEVNLCSSAFLPVRRCFRCAVARAYRSQVNSPAQSCCKAKFKKKMRERKKKTVFSPGHPLCTFLLVLLNASGFFLRETVCAHRRNTPEQHTKAARVQALQADGFCARCTSRIERIEKFHYVIFNVFTKQYVIRPKVAAAQCTVSQLVGQRLYSQTHTQCQRSKRAQN